MLPLPEPIRDAERVIRLGALSRTVLDRPWRLPRIRAEGLFWQEGNITLLTPDPLVAKRITPFDCEQTGTGPLASPRTGESEQFQSFAPDATVELLLSRRPATVRMLGAAAIGLAREEATARVAIDLQTAEGACPAIDVDVAKPWIIDAVESAPAGKVADWTLEPAPNGNHTLAIRLTDALSAARPIGLVITARRPFSPTVEKLGIDDLWPLHFREVTDVKRLVSLRSAGAYAIHTTGAEHLARLTAPMVSRPRN